MATIHMPIKCFHSNWIEFEIGQLKQYINFMESHLDKEKKLIEKQYNEHIRKIETEKATEMLDPEYEAMMNDHFVDEYWLVDKVFLKNHRYSQIILIFSFMEIRLKRGCDLYRARYEKEYGINDLRGGGDMEKIKIFLSKSMNIKVNELQPYWGFLDNLRKIRNIIVHRNGIVQRKAKEFRALEIYSKNRFTIKSNGDSEKCIIVLDRVYFLFEVLENISKLFLRIGELEKKSRMISKAEALKLRKKETK